MLRENSNEALAFLREDFRRHLQQFYASLNLAPPYHSVEKAVRYLSTALKTKRLEEQRRIVEDTNLKWAFYVQVFMHSGLNQKHRGIIRGLIQSDQPPPISQEHWHFLKLFST